MGLFLHIVDSFVKPFLTVISLPLTIITLGISSSCSTALCWSSPTTCRSTCWASASSPALTSLYGQHPGMHHAQYPR
ncbi:MAG: hypothetical protein ACLU37_00685 [Collinsella sp.]